MGAISVRLTLEKKFILQHHFLPCVEFCTSVRIWPSSLLLAMVNDDTGGDDEVRDAERGGR